VPIVTTNVGGVPFLLDNARHALLVPARDPDGMAQAALRIFDDRALAERLRSEGLAHAASFSWERVRPRLYAVYAGAMQPHGDTVTSP
jgi:glycosyltransferase involved in cell wall biosynthesis